MMDILTFYGFIFCNLCFYFLGWRRGLRENKKQILHIAESLAEQNDQIATVRHLHQPPLEEIKNVNFGSNN